MKKYICKYCGIEFNIPQKLGGHVLGYHKIENSGSAKLRRKRIEEYNKNPKLCKECGLPLKYDDVVYNNKVFCSHSCSATFSNQRRPKKERKKTKRSFCKKHADYSKTKRNKYINEWLESGSLPTKWRPGIWVRDYIAEKQDNKCAVCDMEKFWNGKEMIFILDHVDGNSTNNNRNNLRLVCPNCNTQLPTYTGRNAGNGRYYRRVRYKEGKSF